METNSNQGNILEHAEQMWTWWNKFSYLQIGTYDTAMFIEMKEQAINWSDHQMATGFL